MYVGPLRFLRAFTVSATCVALTLAMHLIGAGSGVHRVSVVAVLGLLMTAVLLTLVLAAFSGRRWTLGRSLVALGAGQVGLHAIFSVLLAPPYQHDPAAMVGGASMVGGAAMGSGAPMVGGASMVLAHGVAVLLIGVAIAVNDSAMDTYFSVASSGVGSGLAVFWPRHLAGLIAALDALSGLRAAAVRGERFARWQRPRLLTDLVVLQGLSRRGPPAPAFAS